MHCRFKGSSGLNWNPLKLSQTLSLKNCNVSKCLMTALQVSTGIAVDSLAILRVSVLTLLKQPFVVSYIRVPTIQWLASHALLS